jgi:hypothetical protein
MMHFTVLVLTILAYANIDRIFLIQTNNLESRCDLDLDLSVVASINAFTEDTSFRHWQLGICSKV